MAIYFLFIEELFFTLFFLTNILICTKISSYPIKYSYILACFRDFLVETFLFLSNTCLYVECWIDVYSNVLWFYSLESLNVFIK